MTCGSVSDFVLHIFDPFADEIQNRQQQRKRPCIHGVNRIAAHRCPNHKPTHANGDGHIAQRTISLQHGRVDVQHHAEQRHHHNGPRVVRVGGKPPTPTQGRDGEAPMGDHNHPSLDKSANQGAVGLVDSVFPNVEVVVDQVSCSAHQHGHHNPSAGSEMPQFRQIPSKPTHHNPNHAAHGQHVPRSRQAQPMEEGKEGGRNHGAFSRGWRRLGRRLARWCGRS